VYFVSYDLGDAVAQAAGLATDQRGPGFPRILGNAVDLGAFEASSPFAGLTPQERFVQALYLDALGRAGTLAELDSWVVFYSTEDQNFVEALYQFLLGRTGGDAEAAGWIDATPQLGRQGVALGFLNSTEYRTDHFETYYVFLLHRPSDPQGLEGWVFSSLDE